MKSGEIIIITLLVVAGFLMADLLVDKIILQSADQRFLMRIGFQAQFYVIIYLFFDLRDSSRRLRVLERRFARVLRVRLNDRDTRKKPKKTMEGK